MYRTVGLLTLRHGGAASEQAQGLEIELGERVLANGEDVTEAIRAPEVSEAASKVATNPAVRAALVEKQRELLRGGDWVAEGRDIGTVVAPGRRGQGLPHGGRRGARAPARGGARHRRRDRPARPGAARRPGRVARALAARDRARRRRARHDRPERSTTWSRASSSSWSGRGEAPDGRGRRLSERRQVDARQPAERHARGRRARAGGRHARPQGDRRRLERARLHADRHRRRRPRGRARDGRGDPPPGADRARGGRSRGARGRRARGPAARATRSWRASCAAGRCR